MFSWEKKLDKRKWHGNARCLSENEILHNVPLSQ